MKLKIAVASVVMLALSACAQTYVGTPYQPGENRVSHVAVAGDMVPKDAIAYQVASTMSNFGLLGALIDAGVQASRRDAVNDALDTVSYDPEPMLAEFVAAELTKYNITSVMVDGVERDKREFLEDYPEVDDASVQAYFDLVLVNHGYVQSGGNLWRPAAFAHVRLVDRETGDVLMENRIAYNIPDTPAGVITLPPNRQYVFQNREDMVNQPERLAEGIDDGLRQIAETAVGLLR